MEVKTVGMRIKAKAILRQRDGPCSDGTRRSIWQGAIQWTGARAKTQCLRRVFYSEADALKHANEEREKWIKLNRMPETMCERQQREDREEAAKYPISYGRRTRVAFDADVTRSENLDGSHCEI